MLLLYVQPILLNFKQSVENYNCESLVIGLTSFKIEGHKISGVDENNKPLLIYPNVKEENIKVWENFNEEYTSISEDNLSQFKIETSRKALWRYEELIYENCWGDNL